MKLLTNKPWCGFFLVVTTVILSAGCEEEYDIELRDTYTPDFMTLTDQEIVIPVGLAGTAEVYDAEDNVDDDSRLRWRSEPPHIVAVYATKTSLEYLFAGNRAGETVLSLSIDGQKVLSVPVTVTPRSAQQ